MASDVKMTPDMENRDPNDLNQHIKVNTYSICIEQKDSFLNLRQGHTIKTIL